MSEVSGRVRSVKLLLTSSGITNDSLRTALVDLLGKPIEEASALVVPTAMNPYSVGQVGGRLMRAQVGASLTGLGWGALGLLELTALPSIDREVWLSALHETDALLAWGGDPVYLAHWLNETGLSEVLPALDLVYVGVSAGAMAATSVVVETFTEPRTAAGTAVRSEDVMFEGGVPRTLVTADGARFVDASLIVHYDNPSHPDASVENAVTWASRIPAATYALDDQSGLKVVDGVVEVVSEGRWHLFEA